MKPSSQVYEHDRLCGVSFTEVFREFVELARQYRERREMEYHIVGRAVRCRRMRLMQPEYAAVFRSDGQEDSDRDTAW